jgi:chromosome segregation ATPase
MGVFGFMKSFGKAKASDVQQGFLQRLVAWDPETASKAEIEEMIAELDKLTIEAGKARAMFEKEQKEADAANANYQKYVAAAEHLNTQVEAGDQSKAVSLEKLLKQLEDLSPEVDRENAEAVEAKEYYEELKEMAEIVATKLKSAKSELAKAQRDMQSAERQQKRAEDKATRAERLAGLRSDTSSMGIAISSMTRQAEEAKAKAAAADMKSALLGEVKKDDQNITDALAAVSGTPTQSMSTSDRLKALRKS